MKLSIALVVVGALAAGGVFAWSEFGLAQGEQKAQPKAQLAQSKSAQPATAAPKAPAKAEPKAKAQQTTARAQTYGDWSYLCDPPPESTGGAAPDCYISQTVSMKNEEGRDARLLLVNASRIGTERRPVLYVFLPWGADVQKEVSFTVDASTTGFRGTVDTCLASGCRVPIVLGDDLIALLQRGKTLSVTWWPVTATQPIRVESSLAGFTAGISAVK